MLAQLPKNTSFVIGAFLSFTKPIPKDIVNQIKGGNMKYFAILLLLITLFAIAGCVNNYGISGTYIDIKNNNTCLDFSSDGTYLIRSLQTSIAVQDKYQIKNNQIILSIPLNSLLGGTGTNNIVITCEVNGNRLNCGKDGGIYQKTESCYSFVTNEMTPTQIPTPISSVVWSGEYTDYMTVTGTYQDISGTTTDLKFNVIKWDTQTTVYSKDFGNPGTSLVTVSYKVPNVWGQEYVAKFVYSRE
jgi:hypothetical protein